MQQLKVLIIEDDEIIAQDIKELLMDWQYMVIGNATNAIDGLALFQDKKPDIALVDVQLNGKADGIDLVEQFNQLGRIPVIFLTGSSDSQTVERAKKALPSAYLLKPFDERNLHISLELAISNFYGNQEKNVVANKSSEIKLTADSFLRNGNTLFIKQNYRFVKISLDDIIYVEADGNYSKIVLKHQKILVRLSLNAVLERLEEEILTRVNRSFAINIKWIEEFNDSEIIVNGKEISLTSAYKDMFIKKFSIL